MVKGICVLVVGIGFGFAIGRGTKKTLTELDLLELEHRFGSFTRKVVEDMLNGTERRWKDG